MLRKCEAMDSAVDAADQSHLPIEQLAELGALPAALRALDRQLDRLQPKQVLATVRLALVGAQLALDGGKLSRMERYLRAAEATEPFNTRKCDRGYSVEAVRRWRAENGLLDPRDVNDDEERRTNAFNHAKRVCDQALATRKTKLARATLTVMESTALSCEPDWANAPLVTAVIERYARLKDGPAIKRLMATLDEEARESIFDRPTLDRLGLLDEAIARAQRDAQAALDHLAHTTDPNIHFPVLAFESEVHYLVAQGQAKAAKQLVKRALGELEHWPAYEAGWCTAAVYASLAQAAAAVGDSRAATALLARAQNDAAQAPIGQDDQALAAATKLRSPTERRHQMATLLARAQRWKELRQVLVTVASPAEAARLCWAIKFELPSTTSSR